jgi:CheY-like chemotaxis protein
VKGLVELHGGTVAASSDGPGRGSEFTVRLPEAAAPPVATPTGPPARAGRRCRILVVDDLRDVADTSALMLQMMGHDARAAYDGLEAVEVAATAEFRPDVVPLDIGLPTLNGYEAARRIRAEPWGGGVTLVALTGWGQDDDRRRALDAGFDHYLTKPVKPDALEVLLVGLGPP